MTSATDPAKRRDSGLSGLISPGTPRTTTPAAPRQTAAPATSALPRDRRRFRPGAGRCSSGRSPAAGGGDAAEAFEGLCRVKFMESLPFVKGQGAEVAVEGKAGHLIIIPVLDE